MSHRGTVTTRVRRIRRGAQEGVEVLPDEVEALWCQPEGSRTRVTVALELKHQVVRGADLAVLIAGSTPIGTLDRSPRPRAVDSANVELASGVVLRTGDGLATLLMRKEDLAVLAILAGWPVPKDLAHGQDAREIAALARS